MNVREIAQGVVHFEEDYRVYCTLVRGRDRAVLWDTGQGKLDLKDWMDARVTTPYLVMNSHGHADHIGGNRRFREVYAPRLDIPLLEAYSNLTDRRPPAYDILPLEAGQVYDLGGLTARVVSLAGHTAGSVGLLLEEHRLLLAGDGLNPTLLLLGQEAAPLSVLRATLTAALDLPFDTYLSSHSPRPLPKEQAAVHLAHLDCLRLEPPSHPGPYGPRVCRSQYREGKHRSVLWIDRRLDDRENAI